MDAMLLMQKGNWKKPISIAHLLERKGCDEFTLLQDQMIVDGYRYEIWWYSYQGRNHILAKLTAYPYTLYFFLLEPGDLFSVQDFRRYLETGTLIKPSVKMYMDVTQRQKR